MFHVLQVSRQDSRTKRRSISRALGACTIIIPTVLLYSSMHPQAINSFSSAPLAKPTNILKPLFQGLIFLADLPIPYHAVKMPINTASHTPHTRFRSPGAVVARAAEIPIFRIAIARPRSLCLAEGTHVAVVRIVGFVNADLSRLDEARDMFELVAFRTANARHPGMMVFPLADTNDGALRIPLCPVACRLVGSLGEVSRGGADGVFHAQVRVLLQFFNHALEERERFEERICCLFGSGDGTVWSLVKSGLATAGSCPVEPAFVGESIRGGDVVFGKALGNVVPEGCSSKTDIAI